MEGGRGEVIMPSKNGVEISRCHHICPNIIYYKMMGSGFGGPLNFTTNLRQILISIIYLQIIIFVVRAWRGQARGIKLEEGPVYESGQLCRRPYFKLIHTI